MGEIKIPEPALLVIGVLHAESTVLTKTIDLLRASLGEIRLVGEPIPFVWTGYYEKEIGANLTRCFLVAQDLVDRDRLSELKLLTNQLEQRMARGDGRRRINLDPGLLSAENFVLATTKNRGHRIYLDQGIFAEVTLSYRQGAFELHPWTFPDYRMEQVLALLASLRTEYLQRMRGLRERESR